MGMEGGKEAAQKKLWLQNWGEPPYSYSDMHLGICHVLHLQLLLCFRTLQGLLTPCCARLGYGRWGGLVG